MSDNSFKGKARRQQKASGSSYMRARREVDSGGAGDGSGTVPESADATQMLSLLGLGDATADEIAALWAARELPVGTGEPVNRAPLLRVPLGLGAGGEPVWLDLKDQAEGGSGPHTLLMGMTGSGKTVVQQSMLAGLCAQHSPDLLQLVLVDTKGCSFSDFADYPHTAAVLGPDDCSRGLMDLVHARRRALAEAGVDCTRGYHELRASADGADLPALPEVLVVVDEFGVLQSEVAGFDDVLVTVMLKGRSLGIHVAAAGQLRVTGLNSLIVLRTSTEFDSMQLVGSAAAFELPRGVGMYSPTRGPDAEQFRGFFMPHDLIADLGRRFAAAATWAPE